MTAASGDPPRDEGSEPVEQPPSLKPGSTLGPYEIVAPIGKGGMGEVYRARDTRLGREVAVKILPTSLSAEPNRLRRFEQEARAASALNHPNILTVHDVGTMGLTHYITMELVEGKTLRELLASGPVAGERLLSLATQLAAGLAKAHSAGIVHRDLKPENVMVTADGVVKILDFGLAKQGPPPAQGNIASVSTVSRRTEPGTVMGTVGYMSPEQVAGRTLDFRSDQFSLGAILYELATGQRAFQRENGAETLAAILRDEPPPIGHSKPDVPAGLPRIVERCLAKDPDGRYGSTRDLLRDLEDIRSIRSGVELHRAGAKGWRALYAIAALLLLVAGAGLASRFRSAAARPAQGGVHAIAVLPFEIRAASPDEEYIADGITEAIITDLAKVHGLMVISRNSVFEYKSRPVNVRRVGMELGVSHVLEGSLQHSGDQLRVNARLTDASSGFQLWAERFDGSAKGLFELQDQIANKVVGSLRLSLAHEAGRRVTGAPTKNPEAYDAYLRGKFRFRQAGVREWEEAIPLFERAVALDPGFALAHAVLANAYVRRFFYLDSDKQWEERAYAEIEKALSLDSGLGEAYLARGDLIWTLSNRFPHERAVAEYRRALDANPNLPEAHAALGRVYQHVGLLDKALEELNAALRLEPNQTSAFTRIATVYYQQRKPDLALAQLQKDPGFPYHWTRAAILSELGREQEAFRLVENVMWKKSVDQPTELSLHAVLLARRGDRARAEEQIARVGQAVRNEPGHGHYHHAWYNVGATYALLGKNQLAVEWLQKAVDEGFPCYPFYESDRDLAGLRNDPAFNAFLAKLKQQWEHYRATL